MWGLLIALIAGVALGYLSPGKTDKSRLFWRGLLWGVVISAVIALLGFLFGINPLGLGDAGFFSLMVSFVVVLVAFLVGVWLGDLIEGRRHAGPGARRT